MREDYGADYIATREGKVAWALFNASESWDEDGALPALTGKQARLIARIVLAALDESEQDVQAELDAVDELLHACHAQFLDYAVPEQTIRTILGLRRTLKTDGRVKVGKYWVPRYRPRLKDGSETAPQ